jgi:hypothetical protein
VAAFALKIAIHVELIDLAAGAPIKITAQVDDTANMSDSPKIVAGGQVSATGRYALVIDGKSIAKIDSDFSGGKRYLALHVDLDAGAGQTIAFNASLAGSSR